MKDQYSVQMVDGVPMLLSKNSSVKLSGDISRVADAVVKEINLAVELAYNRGKQDGKGEVTNGLHELLGVNKLIDALYDIEVRRKHDL